MDGHLRSGYTNACIACYATALVKIEVPVQKFYAPINPISPAVAELSSQKLKVPELTQLKMRGAGTPFRRVPPYFDPWLWLSTGMDRPIFQHSADINAQWSTRVYVHARPHAS